jgi:hypothetical protein
VAGGWRRLHDEINNRSSSPIIREITSMRMAWGTQHPYKRWEIQDITRKTRREKPFGKLRCRLEDNLK